MFEAVDWRTLFVPQTPVLEILLRGFVTYVGLFVLLRVVLKRQSGAVGISDLLVIVLIADAAQNAMADDYKSVPDGLLLVGVLIATNYFLDWLGYTFPWFEKLLYPRPLMLVKEGRMLLDNMRKELITRAELMSQLREQGVAKLDDVKAAYMEGDGTLSVVQAEGAPEATGKPPSTERRLAG